MADGSKIEWTDATWNVVIGCDKVSPGCDHCYAIRTAHRMQANRRIKFNGKWVDQPLLSDGRQADGSMAVYALPRWWVWR